MRVTSGVNGARGFTDLQGKTCQMKQADRIGFIPAIPVAETDTRRCSNLVNCNDIPPISLRFKAFHLKLAAGEINTSAALSCQILRPCFRTTVIERTRQKPKQLRLMADHHSGIAVH